MNPPTASYPDMEVDDHSTSRWCSDVRARPSVYRALILAGTVSSVVGEIGGWGFDRNYAGWEATVLVGDRRGGRSLQMLGARVLDLEAALLSRVYTMKVDVLATTSDIERDDQLIGEIIGRSLRNQRRETCSSAMRRRPVSTSEPSVAG